MTATFSVLMPTCGRSTLERAISSVVDQLEDDDELIVVGDGEQDVSAVTVGDFQPASLFYVETQRPGSVFGNAQRDFAMELAAGRSSHLLFLDDDDVYVHGALDYMRAVIHDRGQPHIFRATWGPGHHAHGVTLWADPVVRESNIATPMVVLPNRPYARSWMDSNERGRNGTTSDFGFLSAAIEECDGACWHEAVVAVVRP